MTIQGFKGFNEALQCQGFQYAVGQTYAIDKKPVRCTENGFHFCEFPFDVWGYYSPALSRFCAVTGDGAVDYGNDDSKVAVSQLHIGSEIGLPGLINAGVKVILERVKWETQKESNTGYRSAATNTGNGSVATNTGVQSVATNTGEQSVATNTGEQSAATNTGWGSAATNTGVQSAATNTGYRSAATNTGYRSAATNTGWRSAATNTGWRSAATNTGEQSAATNTGWRSAATNTGYRSAATNTGNQSAATNTGNGSVATVEGQESVALAMGYQSRAKGALGCWLVLAEWDAAGKHIQDVQSVRVDGERIQANTWYRLKQGQFVVDAGEE